MSIEDSLDRIATSLEKIEARFAGDVPAKPPIDGAKGPQAAGKAETAAAKKKRLKAEAVAAAAASDPLANDEPPTKEEVRDILTKVTDEHGRDVIIALFQRLGVANLKGLDEDNYQKAIDLGQAALDDGPGDLLGGTED